jgi:hypothetical protein
MTKLKLGAIEDERPVKLTIQLAARVHRDLIAYAHYLNSRHVAVAFCEADGPWRR